MTRYVPGFHGALVLIDTMSRDELIDYIDALYGFTNSPDTYTDDELREEARAQCRRDYTVTAGAQYLMDAFGWAVEEVGDDA